MTGIERIIRRLHDLEKQRDESARQVAQAEIAFKRYKELLKHVDRALEQFKCSRCNGFRYESAEIRNDGKPAYLLSNPCIQCGGIGIYCPEKHDPKDFC